MHLKTIDHPEFSGSDLQLSLDSRLPVGPCWWGLYSHLVTTDQDGGIHCHTHHSFTKAHFCVDTQNHMNSKTEAWMTLFFTHNLTSAFQMLFVAFLGKRQQVLHLRMHVCT